MKIKKTIFGIAALGVLSCSNGTGSEQITADLSSSQLPELTVYSECAEDMDSELETCTWVDSLNGLIFGEVIDIEFVMSPSY